MWHDGALVDVAAGWRRYGLDGSAPVKRYSGYGPGFDAAVMAPAADVVALVVSTGTKALLLEPGGKVIRELNRSFYCAEDYRYPLALFTLPDGRTGLVHCPDRYNQLEIEVARTGERLTADRDRDPDDFFHSRLAVSPDGRFLLVLPLQDQTPTSPLKVAVRRARRGDLPALAASRPKCRGSTASHLPSRPPRCRATRSAWPNGRRISATRPTPPSWPSPRVSSSARVSAARWSCRAPTSL